MRFFGGPTGERTVSRPKYSVVSKNFAYPSGASRSVLMIDESSVVRGNSFVGLEPDPGNGKEGHRMARLRGAQCGALMQQLGRLFLQGSLIGSSEGELLDRFVRGRDESAFEALVARHGPMVLSVCRQLLRDPNDVDDAFQATFLVLVRKAGTFRRA